MPIKDILVGLSVGDEQDRGRHFALSMAAEFGAQVTGLAYALEPPMSFSVYPEFTSEIMQRHRTEARQAVELVREGFVEAANRAGVPHDFHSASVTVQQATSDFAYRLRTADIAVLTQHQAGLEHFGDLFAEAALFHSGRPMIVVPKDHADRFSAERVLIAWDGSIHAARAVAAAMPLLKRASKIEVLTIKEASKASNLRGNELVRHLRLHNLNAVLCERDNPDIPGSLIKEAGLFHASLIVMGGYGHSRLREFVFGGATRLMLSKLPVPVLMTH